MNRISKSLLIMFLSLSYFYFINTFSTKEKENQNYLTPNMYNQKCEEKNVIFSYYNPLRGGINCDSECRYTASGEEILDKNGNPISNYWWNGENAGVACPENYHFGTIFLVDFPDGTRSVFTCIDRGSKIIESNNLTRLDILHNDGLESYSWPITKKGYRINEGPYKACIY